MRGKGGEVRGTGRGGEGDREGRGGGRGGKGAGKMAMNPGYIHTYMLSTTAGGTAISLFHYFFNSCGYPHLHTTPLPHPSIYHQDQISCTHVYTR